MARKVCSTKSGMDVNEYRERVVRVPDATLFHFVSQQDLSSTWAANREPRQRELIKIRCMVGHVQDIIELDVSTFDY